MEKSIDTKVITGNEAAANFWADECLDKRHADKKEIFRAKLLKLLKANPGWRELYNDYDPNGLLLEALQQSGIECRGCLFSGDGIFPRKTGCFNWDNKIQVKRGYGGDHVQIWPIITEAMS